MDNYKSFAKWIDTEFRKNPPTKEVTAFAFNLFIDEDEDYVGTELIGTEEYERGSKSWLITEVWGNRQPPFKINGHELPDDWRIVRDEMCEMIKKYLNEGKYSDIFKSREAVVTGYADGDDSVIDFDVITLYRKDS